jgi:hypothetical protein
MLQGLTFGPGPRAVFQADSDADNVFAMNGKDEVSGVKPVGIFPPGNRHRRIRQRFFELAANMTEALTEIEFKVIAKTVIIAISPYALFS